MCEDFEVRERERERVGLIKMKRSEKIGICVKFQKSFIRLRMVDLLKSKQEDLVVQVRRNDVFTFSQVFF